MYRYVRQLPRITATRALLQESALNEVVQRIVARDAPINATVVHLQGLFYSLHVILRNSVREASTCARI